MTAAIQALLAKVKSNPADRLMEIMVQTMIIFREDEVATSHKEVTSPTASQPPKIFGCGNPPYIRKKRSAPCCTTETPGCRGHWAAMPNHEWPTTRCDSSCQNPKA